MTASDQELLPTSLAERLTAEQRQALAEAPREKRLETLAAALARPEPEVLEKLAAAASVTRAAST